VGKRKRDRKMYIDREGKVCVIVCKRINKCGKVCKKYSIWSNRGYCILCVNQADDVGREALLTEARRVCNSVRRLMSRTAVGSDSD